MISRRNRRLRSLLRRRGLRKQIAIEVPPGPEGPDITGRRELEAVIGDPPWGRVDKDLRRSRRKIERMAVKSFQDASQLTKLGALSEEVPGSAQMPEEYQALIPRRRFIRNTALGAAGAGLALAGALTLWDKLLGRRGGAQAAPGDATGGPKAQNKGDFDAPRVSGWRVASEFKASGDGTSGNPFDALCIQTAANDPGAQAVFVPTAYYQSTDPNWPVIKGKTNFAVIGAGPGSRIVTQGDAVGIQIGKFEASGGVSEFYLGQIFIDGSSQTAAYLDLTQQIKRVGVLVEQGNGGNPGATVRVLIDHLQIFNTGADSIISNLATNGVISNCIVRATRNGFASIHAHSGEAWVVANNVIIASNTGALRHGSVIIGNRIKTNNFNITDFDTTAIYSSILGDSASGTYGSVIIGNVLTAVQGCGIHAWSSGHAILGNIVEVTGLGSANLPYRGVAIAIAQSPAVTPVGPALGVMCAYNVILKAYKQGIYVDKAQNSTVAFNTIIDSSQNANGDVEALRVGHDGFGTNTTDYSKNNIVAFNTIYSNSGTANLPLFGIRDQDSNDSANIYVFNQVLQPAAASSKLSISGSSAKIMFNPGFVTEANVLSGTFAIDSTGVKTVTIAHGLNYTPALQDPIVSLVENTVVADGRIDWVKVSAVDATNVTVKVLVGAASATGGSTAKVALKVDRR